MDFSDCAEGLNKGSCSIAELTNVNQAVPHSGKPWHVSVTLLCSWRNGITISYELNCSRQTCLVSTHGSDTSIWPCPGRRERMYRTCRMQISWVQWSHGVFVIIKPKRYIYPYAGWILGMDSAPRNMQTTSCLSLPKSSSARTPEGG